MNPIAIPSVSVAVRRGDTVLLVKRGREPSRGYFAFPGGRVETGETSEEAARRELMEETSVAAQNYAPVREYLFDAVKDGAPVRYRLLVFSADHLSGEAIAADDAEEAAWFDLDAMRSMLLSDKVFEVAEEVLGRPPR